MGLFHPFAAPSSNAIDAPIVSDGIIAISARHSAIASQMASSDLATDIGRLASRNASSSYDFNAAATSAAVCVSLWLCEMNTSNMGALRTIVGLHSIYNFGKEVSAGVYVYRLF